MDALQVEVEQLHCTDVAIGHHALELDQRLLVEIGPCGCDGDALDADEPGHRGSYSCQNTELEHVATTELGNWTTWTT